MHVVEQFTPLMNAVVSHIHEGVILSDPRGNVLYHNPAATELLGVSALASMHEIHDTIDLDSSRLLPNAGTLKRIEASGNPHTSSGQCFQRRIHCNGLTRFVEVNASEVTLPGEVEPVQLMVMSDITERRRFEAVLYDNLSAGFITQRPVSRSDQSRLG